MEFDTSSRMYASAVEASILHLFYIYFEEPLDTSQLTALGKGPCLPSVLILWTVFFGTLGSLPSA